MLAEHFGVVTPLFDEGVGLLLDQERLVFDWIRCRQKLGASTYIVGPTGGPSLGVVGVKLLLFEVSPDAEVDRKYDKRAPTNRNSMSNQTSLTCQKFPVVPATFESCLNHRPHAVVSVFDHEGQELGS